MGVGGLAESPGTIPILHPDLVYRGVDTPWLVLEPARAKAAASVPALHCWTHENKSIVASLVCELASFHDLHHPRLYPNTSMNFTTVISNEETMYRQIGDYNLTGCRRQHTQRRRHPSSCRYLILPRAPNRRVSSPWGRSRRRDDGRLWRP